MKKLISVLPIALVAILLVPSVVFAAKPTNPGGGNGGGKPTPTEPPTQIEYKGYDISYPQCGNRNLKKLPTDHYFGIVGVNGGTAASQNPCLAEQLAWANKAKTYANQPKVQLYVNTANPADGVDGYTGYNWPTNGENDRYGACTGAYDLACSWQYGWNRSAETASYFVSKAGNTGISTSVGDYTWWLDVETMNSWQPSNLALNTAALEGFAAYYQSQGAKVGLYSTSYQWGVITGSTVSSDSNLNNLSSWLAGAANLSSAISKCNEAPLTAGGTVTLAQYVVKNLDNNHSCI